MTDLTQDCLQDLSQKKEEKVKVSELREYFCNFCNNQSCEHAKMGHSSWVERITTQEERLLENPNFADLQNSKWESLRAIDFPERVDEIIRLSPNLSMGSWDPPEDVDIFSGRPKVSYQDGQEVEQAVKTLKGKSVSVEEEDQTPEFVEPETETENETVVLDIASKTDLGVTYQVTLVRGQAQNCTCKAGQYGKPCIHRKWAEEKLQQQQQQSSEKESSEQNPGKDKRGVSLSLPQKKKILAPETPRYENTASPSQGRMVERERPPVGGFKNMTKDPWDPKSPKKADKGQTIQTESGLSVTVGKKGKDE